MAKKVKDPHAQALKVNRKNLPPSRLLVMARGKQDGENIWRSLRGEIEALLRRDNQMSMDQMYMELRYTLGRQYTRWLRLNDIANVCYRLGCTFSGMDKPFVNWKPRGPELVRLKEKGPSNA